MQFKHEGWFKWHRKIQKHSWLNNDSRPYRRTEAWMFLCANAEYTTSKRKGRHHNVEVNRGEILISEAKLAEIWGWSKSSVHKFLHKLIEEKMIIKISNEKDNKNGAVYKIINYQEYQGEITQKETNALKNSDKNGSSLTIKDSIQQDLKMFGEQLYDNLSKYNKKTNRENFVSITPFIDLLNEGNLLYVLVSIIDWIGSCTNASSFWISEIKDINSFKKHFETMSEQFFCDHKYHMDKNIDVIIKIYESISTDLILFCISKYQTQIENLTDYRTIYPYEREIRICKEILKNRKE
jgi:DNA-binding MarR family transcriptional regulator